MVVGRVGGAPRSLNPDPVYDKKFRIFIPFIINLPENRYPVYDTQKREPVAQQVSISSR